MKFTLPPDLLSAFFNCFCFEFLSCNEWVFLRPLFVFKLPAKQSRSRNMLENVKMVTLIDKITFWFPVCFSCYSAVTMVLATFRNTFISDSLFFFRHTFCFVLIIWQCICCSFKLQSKTINIIFPELPEQQ